jgi:hypothetical protein
MRARIVWFAVSALVTASPAHAQQSWNGVCDSVGRFAAIVATEREGRAAVEAAVQQARGQLPDDAVLPGDVADEIAHEVYLHPAMTPVQAKVTMRARCLAVQATRVAAMPAPPEHPVVAALIPIALHSGVNAVADFLPGGGPAIVRLAWHDDGNGHGRDVFTASVPGAGRIGMPDGDSVADEPRRDYDMTRSVRFARGRIDGKPATLLLIAQRQPGSGPTATVYQVFRLARDASGFRFAVLSQRTLPSGFCNADMALSAASGLKLRVSYRGALTRDGCPAPARG